MKKFAIGLCLTLPFSALLAAQGVSPGFSTEPLEYAPPLFSFSSTLNDSGESIVFDGLTIDRVAFDGTLLENYVTLPGFTFASFLVVSDNRRFALAGESSFGEIIHVDLVLGTTTSLGFLDLNYDAAIDENGIAYISAATSTPDFNDLYRIDPSARGSFDLLAQVPGFSGPVALEPNGDLLLGVSSTPNRIIRYTSAQLLSGSPLDESDGELVSTGWAGVLYMTVDPKSGAILVAEHDFVMFMDPAAIMEVDGDKSTSKVVYEADAGIGISKLQMLTSGVNRAVFAPFQPERGCTLLFGTSDFFSMSERRVVRPKRPVSALAGPGVAGTGAVTYVCTGAEPNAGILLFYGLTMENSPYEVAIPVGDVPFFWTLDPLTQVLLPSLLATDATGRVSFDFTNPGLFTGIVTLQTVVVDGIGNLVGSAPAVSL